MTVLLIGIGADGKNTSPMPPLLEDGRFDYLPIPDTEASTGPTYDDFELPNFGGKASEFVNRIRPGGKGEWIQDPEVIGQTPLHHDPNFQHLTYGDVMGTRKGARIRSDLQVGDIIGFYAGLQTEYRHRYIIGYFTVAGFGDDHANHPENAHGKRFLASGRPKHDDIVIVDGEEPGGLLSKPYRISRKIDKPPWHEVSPEAVDALNIIDGTVAVSIKPPLTLDLEPDEFIDMMPSLR